MINVIKFFFTALVLSYVIVWISDHPGTIKIFWSEYLIETNLLGFFLVFFGLIFLIVFGLRLFSKIKNIPKSFKIAKKNRDLILGNETLDNIALNLLVGDFENLEKNSRKIRKYFNNQLFSTFMLFNSSLMKNDIEQAKKYLRVLELIPKADYLFKRSKVLLALKESDKTIALKYLQDFTEEYKDDDWFSGELAIMYACNGEWKLALDSLNNKVSRKNPELLKMIVNLKVLNGENAISAQKLCNESIFVLVESIKRYLEKNEVKKAAVLLQKNWMKFQCFEIVEIFMKFKTKNISDSLRRYKLVTKSIKKTNSMTDESKLSLAYSAYCAEVWGESQTYLDLINLNKWDERILNLYKSLAEKSSKITVPENENKILPKPKWFCKNCNYRYDHWKFVCEECNSVNKINWPKVVAQTKDSAMTLLQNPLRHFPQMEREN